MPCDHFGALDSWAYTNEWPNSHTTNPQRKAAVATRYLDFFDMLHLGKWAFRVSRAAGDKLFH